MRARSFLLFVVCAGSALGLGCVGLPHPDAADVERAQKRWPGTDQAALEEGRRLYVRKCAGCHTLYLPQSRSPQQWPPIVEEMSREAGVGPHDQALIEQFLVTLSGRPAQPASPAR